MNAERVLGLTVSLTKGSWISKKKTLKIITILFILSALFRPSRMLLAGETTRLEEPAFHFHAQI